MQFATSGQASTWCATINASTNNITLTADYWPPLTSVPTRLQSADYAIARAFFRKASSALPGGMEEQKIYYLRRTGSNVQVYSTFAGALDQSNPVTFNTSLSGYLFSVYFLDFCHRHLNTWQPAQAQLSDIPCCPPVPEVYTECPDTATVTYNGQQIAIKMGAWAPQQDASGMAQIGLMQTGNGGFSAGPLLPFFITIPPNSAGWAGYAAFSVSATTWTPGGWRPMVRLRLYEIVPDPSSGEWARVYGSAYYMGSADPNTTSSMDCSYMGDEYLEGIGGIVDNLGLARLMGWIPDDGGIIRTTIHLDFSGSIQPPPQVRVVMPDAFFLDKSKAISLGNVEEVLTYDPASLTYWSEVRTYAGISGRLHFSIPNFLPLATASNRFITTGYGGNRIFGDYPYSQLNTFTNMEITLYETCRIEYIQPPGAYPDDPSYGLIPDEHRLFAANDAYGGYPTGLPQGTPWFDSRIYRNINIATGIQIGANWALHNGRPITQDFVQRFTARMLIAFSKWGSARHNTATGVRWFDSAYWSHYSRSFYAIKSVHPHAHITSLVGV